MRSRQRVIQALRDAGKASPRALRGPIGRASRRFRSGFAGPLVTVVVPISDQDTTKIGSLLWDLRNQSHRNLEVRLEPWGRCVAVRATAAEHADDDWRLVLPRRTSSDKAAALHRGAAAARGAYLIFAGGGDNVPVHGVARLVRSLEASGSDLAVGRMRTPQTPLPVVDSPFGAAHTAHRVSLSLPQAPIAVTDLGLGNRMWRRTFWERCGIRFDPARPSGTDVALASYAVGRFDLLAEDVYTPTDRRDGVAVGSAPDILSTLDDWLAEHQATQLQLERLGNHEVTDAWLWGVLDTAIIPFLDDAERATAEQWATLRQHIGRLLDAAGEPMWDTLSAESKVKLWLARHDKRAELEQMVVDRLFQRGERRTEVVQGRVIADLPYRGDAAVGVPDHCYLMAESETALVVEARAVRWAGPTTLEIDLLAYPDFVALPEPPEMTVALVDRRDGSLRRELPLRQYQDRGVDSRLEGRRYQDVSHGTATVTIDAAALAAAGEGSWALEVTIGTQGVWRTGRVSRLDDRGIVELVGTPHLPFRQVETPGEEGTVAARVGVTGRDASIFAVDVRVPYPVGIVSAQVSGRRITGLLEGSAKFVRVDMAGLSHRAEVAPDGRFTLEVPLPWEGKEHLRWRVSAETADGRTSGIAWRPENDWLAVGEGAVALGRSAEGGVSVVEAARTLVLDDVRLVEGAVAVRGHWLGRTPSGATLMLRGDRVTPTSAVDAESLCALSTRWDEWKLGARPVPQGFYAFEVVVDGAPGHVLFGGGVIADFAASTVEHGYRYLTALRAGDHGLWLIRPLGDDERGPFNQGRLQDWATTLTEIDEHAVYFQSYAGASATDSQLAIHEELRRTRPELSVSWGVADSSSWVPEGAVPVLIGSRDYYRAMTTSKYLCMNVDADRWFAIRPEQRMLQTFHGYPAKSMGIRMWRAKGFTERRIQLELDRTSRDWSLILTPAPEMDVHYRTEYRYDGPIHSDGYPRDDAIVLPSAAQVRAETRARLGIRPDQKVVLYAPTWRDDQATNWREADAVHHLDVADASRRLGEEYVVLMRGHRFHAAALKRAEGARLIDVTTYPEINDLILASDAAVLDYSSLRFDFALTGRPMVFLVPDLADYTGGIRGFLFDYRDTAPGPLLDTADQVIHALGDLDALARQWSPRIAEFNATYNYKADGHAAERVVKAFFAD